MIVRQSFLGTSAAWLAVSFLAATVFWPTFVQPVGGDFVAYALPSANWVERGRLSLPQLGEQYALDQYWRFSSPLMGAGPALPFWLGGVSHGSYLAGLAVLLFFMVGGMARLFQRAMGDHHAFMWLLVTAALVSIRSFQCVELINQRYTAIAPLALGSLFFPDVLGSAKWWKWALAGALPLIHPALLPASCIWILAELIWIARRKSAPVGGLMVCSMGVGVCAWWYLTPETFRTQFFPHLTSREFDPFSGWSQSASWKYSVPSQIIQFIVVYCAFVALTVVVRVERAGRILVLLGAMVLADATGRMMYLNYYTIGLAPAIFYLVRERREFRSVMLALSLLGVANASAFVKLNPGPPRSPTGQHSAELFIATHTREGEKICLGPPFTLAAAKPHLPGGRTVPFVVPTALYLKDFDEDDFLLSIRSNCSIYIGSPDYYNAVQRYYRLSSPAIFLDASIQEFEFEGQRVIVARIRP